MPDHCQKQPYTDNNGHHHDIEFLPCPFCGSKPHVVPKGNSYTKRRSVTVRCKSCRIERTDAALRYDFDWLYAVAAKNWNQRLHPDDQPYRMPRGAINPDWVNPDDCEMSGN